MSSSSKLTFGPPLRQSLWQEITTIPSSSALHIPGLGSTPPLEWSPPGHALGPLVLPGCLSEDRLRPLLESPRTLWCTQITVHARTSF